MKAPDPIIRQIVNRCHVGDSNLRVIRYAVSCLNKGPKTFLALKRGLRRQLMRDAIRVHATNRQLYRRVMRGF